MKLNMLNVVIPLVMLSTLVSIDAAIICENDCYSYNQPYHDISGWCRQCAKHPIPSECTHIDYCLIDWNDNGRCDQGSDEIDLCPYGHDCDDCGAYGGNNQVSCNDTGMLVTFNTMMMPTPLDVSAYKLGGVCSVTSQEDINGITCYYFQTSDLESCGITATQDDESIIYSTAVMRDGMTVLNVKCIIERTQTLSKQIMANPCLVPVTIIDYGTFDVEMTWYADGSYDDLQPDDQYANMCEDTNIYIGVKLITDANLGLVVALSNCSVYGNEDGSNILQTFPLVDEFGCPVGGMEFDDGSTETEVLFFFDLPFIVNNDAITVFDLACDVTVCGPDQTACTPICVGGIVRKLKKSIGRSIDISGSTFISSGPFILNRCK